jgi:methyl-accepting chemotaxis protein
MTQTAALIAAISFGMLALAGVVALLRMARLMSESTRLVADLRERGGVLLDRAQVAVDGAQAAVARAERQLDKSEPVAASMDELGTGMAELASQVTALAGFGRALAGGPVGRAAALAYGVRHAVGLRRPGGGRRTLPGSVVERDGAAR